MKPTFFKSQAEFRQWFEQHHCETRELWVGFYRKESGSLTHSDLRYQL